jgi:hypothetical protein
MSVHRCLEWAELAALSRVPAGDPARREAERCVRCRSRLAEYHDFVAGGDEVPAAERDHARAALRATLEQAMAEDAVAPATAPVLALPRPRRAPWWTGGARLALAAGVVAVMAGVVVVARRPAPVPGAVNLRGGDADGGSVRTGSPALWAPEAAGGAVRLRWSSVPGADRYRVRVLSAQLEEVATVWTSDTTLTLERVALPPGVRAGAALGWRVIAEREGAEIATSATGTLRAP